MIDQLGLEPHPEGGWYRRTWTAPAPVAAGPATEPTGAVRAAGSSILYLLAGGRRSHWHRVDATELWQHCAGDPLELLVGDPSPVTTHRLGRDLMGGEVPQVVVGPGAWQSATVDGAWALAVCVVVPEFRFEHFELAPEGWSPAP